MFHVTGDSNENIANFVIKFSNHLDCECKTILNDWRAFVQQYLVFWTESALIEICLAKRPERYRVSWRKSFSRSFAMSQQRFLSQVRLCFYKFWHFASRRDRILLSFYLSKGAWRKAPHLPVRLCLRGYITFPTPALETGKFEIWSVFFVVGCQLLAVTSLFLLTYFSCNRN